jgi:dolichyl-phosphate beta-glucosyltransferase
LDTQCGFKLFRAAAAQKLFSAMRENRYLFDLELLLLAREFHFKVVEVPIRWHEVSGGHMRLATELPRIIAGLWRLRRRRRALQGG